MVSSTVSAKVEFSRHMTGAEIMDLVKETVGNRSGDRSLPAFFSEQRDKHKEVFSIGQTSSRPHEHMVIIPPRRGIFGIVDYLRINQSYPAIEVISRSADEAAVEAFAQKLRERLMALR